MAVRDAETRSLDVHVAACAERYRTLFNRIKRIEKIIWIAVVGLIANLAVVIGGLLVALWKMQAGSL